MGLSQPPVAGRWCRTVLLAIALSVVAHPQPERMLPERTDEQRLETERMKERWAAAAAILPPVVALLALGYVVLSLRKMIAARFVMKAAEVALEGPGPQETINRARLLASMFVDMLPPDFTQRFADQKPTDHGWASHSAMASAKKELIKLLAEYPGQRAQIIEDWRSLFPADNWVDDIAVPLSTTDLDFHKSIP